MNSNLLFSVCKPWMVTLGVFCVVVLGGLLPGCHEESDTPIVPEVDPCAGTSVGGACWYYGDIGESCEVVCALYGGYDEATRTYAGSDGTDSNCSQVLDALGALPDTDGQLTTYTEGQGLGCHVWVIALGTEGVRAQWYRSLASTTPEAASADPWVRRACACQQ
jgi:hypothetical protein